MLQKLYLNVVIGYFTLPEETTCMSVVQSRDSKGALIFLNTNSIFIDSLHSLCEDLTFFMQQ